MPPWKLQLRLLPCFVSVLLAARGPAAAAEPTSKPAEASYYMVVYGAEDGTANPLKTHCFATFIKLANRAKETSHAPIELRHINWFTKLGHDSGVPHGLLNDGLLERPEPGENRDTASAFETAARHQLS